MSTSVDTTKDAKQSPHKAQPWKELGLKLEEYEKPEIASAH